MTYTIRVIIETAVDKTFTRPSRDGTATHVAKDQGSICHLQIKGWYNPSSAPREQGGRKLHPINLATTHTSLSTVTMTCN